VVGDGDSALRDRAGHGAAAGDDGAVIVSADSGLAKD
jgi:hypothetical protein